MTDSPKIAKFNDIDLNVFPYILRRDPTGIVNYVSIYQCSVNHSQYLRLKETLLEQFKNTKIGKGGEVDLLDTIDFKKYKHTMYYILDLRSIPDLKWDPIIIKNISSIKMWIYNAFTQELLDSVKGLIIFVDDVSQLSPYLLSKSITGLCDSNLETFLNVSCSTKIGAKVIEQEEATKDKLKGYVSGEKWTRLAIFDN